MKEIRIEDNCIAKGIYAHPQNSGYMSLKQYVIMELQGKRCLLLRFENEASFEITQAEFILKQLNAKGEIIDSSTLKYSNIALYPAQTYSPKEGVALKSDCFDFMIEPVSLVGGKYLYKFDNGIVTAHYDSRGYKDRTAYKKKNGRNDVTVTRKYSGGGGGFHRRIAFISILMIALFLAIILCYHMFYSQIYSMFDSVFGSDNDTEVPQMPNGGHTIIVTMDTTAEVTEEAIEDDSGEATEKVPNYTVLLPPLRPTRGTDTTATLEPLE